MSEPESKPKEKWYFRTPVVIMTMLSVGPLGLPLVWFHPRYPLWVKILTTAAAAAGTYYLIQLTDRTIQAYSAYYEELFKLVKQLR